MMTDRFGTEQYAAARQAELVRDALATVPPRRAERREPPPRAKFVARLAGVALAGMLLFGLLTVGGGLGDAAGAGNGGGGGGGAVGYVP
jgi:hypothetical protein